MFFRCLLSKDIVNEKIVKFPFDENKVWNASLQRDDLPRNDLKKQVILQKITEGLSFDRVYLETEIKQHIKQFFSESTTIRRELVNFGYMNRNPREGTYILVKRNLTIKDIRNNTLLAQHAKSYGIE